MTYAARPIDGKSTNRFNATALDLPDLAWPKPFDKAVPAYKATLSTWARMTGEHGDLREAWAAADKADRAAFAKAALDGTDSPTPTAPAIYEQVLRLEVMLEAAARAEKTAAAELVKLLREHSGIVTLATVASERESVEKYDQLKARAAEAIKETRDAGKRVGKAATRMRALLGAGWQIPSVIGSRTPDMPQHHDEPVKIARQILDRIEAQAAPPIQEAPAA